MKKSRRKKLQIISDTNYRVNVFGVSQQSTDQENNSVKNQETMNNVTLNSIMKKLSAIDSKLDRIEKQLESKLTNCGCVNTSNGRIFIPGIVNIEDKLRKMIEEQLEQKTMIKSNRYGTSQNHNSRSTRGL